MPELVALHEATATAPCSFYGKPSSEQRFSSGGGSGLVAASTPFSMGEWTTNQELDSRRWPDPRPSSSGLLQDDHDAIIEAELLPFQIAEMLNTLGE